MILGICGAGDAGREIFDTAGILLINQNSKRWKSFVYIDDFKDGQTVKGLPVIDFEKFKTSYDTESAEIVIAVGEPQLRKKIADEVINAGYKLASIIHPNVYIPETAKIGDGVVICAQAIVSCNVVIKNNVYLNINAIVGHDCIIEENTVISGLVQLGGHSHIGQNTFIGMNTCVKEKTTIGNNCIISMGSSVYRDVADSLIVIGNPARPIKKNEDGKVFKK